jgi:hypothetical protein
MRARALFSLVGALVAAVALVSASGAAGSKTQKVTRIDVSTRAAVVHYLRSIHVNPRGAVIERGARNYAGAHCPGTRWTCASTRPTVVQIAKRGGQNRFVCGSAQCVVVQFTGASHGMYVAQRDLASTATPSTKNKAVCIKTTGLGASCSITQSSATMDNQAVVVEGQLAPGQKGTGLTQTASYTASITQQATGASNRNTACVTQAVNIDGSTNASGKKGSPVGVTLEAHQSVTIRQDSTGTGDHAGNFAQSGADATGACVGSAITQSQSLSSTVTGSGSITQNEDAAFSACGDGVSGDYANLCLDIEQNQGIGHGVASRPNNATFTQTSTQTAVANTPAGPVTQTQSSICANGPSDCVVPGGLVGTVNQDSTGISTANATQLETQCEDAATSALSACHTVPPAPPGTDADFNGSYTLTQNQYGPVGVGKLRNHPLHRRRQLFGHLKGLPPGTSSQTGGNSGDMFTITQTSTQDNDQGSNGSTSNQQNFGQADCSTSGTCTATQTTTVDGTPTTNTQSGQDVNTQTTCSGSTCTSTGPSLTFLPNGLSVSNTDVREFGYGGMRSSGTGSITVSGITAPVFRAFLFWNGPTNSTDPNSNASVKFNGTPITGTNIGTASDNNWGFLNGQSYRADVTGLVTGDGTYTLSNFIKENTAGACSATSPPGPDCVADINGAALIIFYNDGNASDDRDVVLWNGNDSNVTTGPPYNTDGWDETLTSVPYPGSGSASLDLVVSDGQNVFDDDALVVNETTIAPSGPIFGGDSTPANSTQSQVDNGSLWDIKSFDITSLLSPGDNSLHITTGVNADYLSLVVAIANVPASAPVIP